MSDNYDLERTAWLPMTPGGETSQSDTQSVVPAGQEAEIADGFDLIGLARALSRLGPVLWLERSVRRVAPARATLGRNGVLLLDHPSLQGLSRCRQISAYASVTAQGPREWLRCGDIGGVALCKCFLLPDTDYLAWDDMAASSRRGPFAPLRPLWPTHSPYARLGGHWRARLLSFDLRQRPWLHSLSARTVARISPLGMELARTIARSEDAELISPLFGT